MVWEYYQDYLDYFYEKNPKVINLSFLDHRQILFDDHYGWPADLSQYMTLKGIETEFIIANNFELQRAWAIENGFEVFSKSNFKYEILYHQIKKLQPDILWIPGLFHFFGNFIKSVKPFCKKIVLWHSAPTPSGLDLTHFDTLITTNPKKFLDYNHKFKEKIITKPPFTPEVLKKVGHLPKKHDITFIGGISQDHSIRCEIISFLIKNGIKVSCFGYLHKRDKSSLWSLFSSMYKTNSKGFFHNLKGLFPQKYDENLEIINSIHSGPIFGMDMYRALAQSRATLNVHIDIAGGHSGNMRMFEATGMGTCLITNKSPSNSNYFDVKNEILTFRSKEDLLTLVKDIRSKKIGKISKAGQRRTLNEHSIPNMFEDIKSVFV